MVPLLASGRKSADKLLDWKKLNTFADNLFKSTMVRQRLLTIMAAVALMALPLRAQDSNILSHFSLSAGVGTTGITADLGTMMTDYVGLRGGIDFMPKIKYSTKLSLSLVNQTIEFDYPEIPERKVNMQGTLLNTTGHAMVDIYPLRQHGFHVTVGAYFAGGEKIVEAVCDENELLKEVADLNARRGEYAIIPIGYGQVAAKLGKYIIMPDDDGNASAYITVKKVRPYLGIGFGRAVPSESRLNCQVDLGVQFSGKPHVYNGVNGEELTAEGANGEDGGYLKTISRMTCYPVISIRLSGRLF